MSKRYLNKHKKSVLRICRYSLQFTHLARFTMLPVHQCWNNLTHGVDTQTFGLKAAGTNEMQTKASSSSIRIDQFSSAINQRVSPSVYCCICRNIGSIIYNFRTLSKIISAILRYARRVGHDISLKNCAELAFQIHHRLTVFQSRPCFETSMLWTSANSEGE